MIGQAGELVGSRAVPQYAQMSLGCPTAGYNVNDGRLGLFSVRPRLVLGIWSRAAAAVGRLRA